MCVALCACPYVCIIGQSSILFYVYTQWDIKAIVSRYKPWLLLYLDLVYGERRTNRLLNYARINKLVKTSLQGQRKAYGSDARVNDQLDRCFCLPLELLSIVAACFLTLVSKRWSGRVCRGRSRKIPALAMMVCLIYPHVYRLTAIYRPFRSNSHTKF